ncbi:hypothetical protein ASQ44_07460 (plasmid) [Rickettsia rhipicephali]|uniref:hypothetical protein n=1 Tax=Rickettsia rhipicephali TaxID=33992 RepID=UPI00070DA708|nr:hypothetical protein [Rickettsia rhipicephali]ALN41908.1 hypothetical protein ASQ44_07460 [Rickettsia rhipicephali]
MSLSDINTKLHQIENDICTLSNMLHTLRVSIASDYKQFSTYLRLVATQQIQLDKTLGMIVDNLESKTACDEEEGLDDFFNNFNKEFK